MVGSGVPHQPYQFLDHVARARSKVVAMMEDKASKELEAWGEEHADLEVLESHQPPAPYDFRH